MLGAGGSGSTTKYDAHHKVLDKTYGAQAGLRRELSDSKAAVAGRAEILDSFAECNDPQRAWLLLEDYFEKLSLSRKDFDSHDWWPRVLSARGKKRLEETALLFLRSSRPLPTELLAHANPAHFAEIEQTEKEQRLAQRLEHWLFPSAPSHLDAPRATLRVICEARPAAEDSALHGLAVSFHISRQRTGDKVKTLGEVAELTARATHEQELFSFADWEFIQWLSESHADPEGLWRLDGPDRIGIAAMAGAMGRQIPASPRPGRRTGLLSRRIGGVEAAPGRSQRPSVLHASTGASFRPGLMP